MLYKEINTDPLSTSSTSNVTSSSGVIQDNKELTQSKETDLSKHISDLKVGNESLTHTARAKEMTVKEGIKANKTTPKALENDSVQANFRLTKVKISESNTKPE
jgi:hypothetical protein